MSTERWQQIESVFAAALDQPRAQRTPFIATRCEDPHMRDEIASLLRAAELSEDFLETPALDVFARQVSREGWSIRAGDRIGVYTVVARLGAGGMGEVWRARDERLRRDVAIKLLLPHPSNVTERAQAFEREARAAGALNHPNVLTVHDVGEHRGASYIVTEFLEGQSLRRRLAAGALSLEDALHIALQVARGLAAAHARGIVHRDLKPDNIFLLADGGVKILDFGLAALSASEGLAGGTAGYTAPEQMRGEPVDLRADIFSFGAVLREMTPDHRPEPLTRLAGQCVATRAVDRPASMRAAIAAIERVAGDLHPPPPPRLAAIVRRPVVIATVIALIAVVAVGTWRWRTAAARVRWTHTVAIPEIRRFFAAGDAPAAFLLAREALAGEPDDPQLLQLWRDVSLPSDLTTDPEGAEVFVAAYRTPASNWLSLGRTPLRGVRIPRGLSRLRITKPGFQTMEGTVHPQPHVRFRLDPAGSAPSGMVRVTGGRDPVRFGSVGAVADFWIDRFEVTNRQFKAFVDAGGYRERAYWQEPFIEDGRAIPWEAAIPRFRDRSGQPGPAAWNRGSPPDGEADFPVGGVSWYEAAAYARFAGASLPTMYHWYRAAALGRFADILPLSNFSGTKPAPVGAHQGLGPFGTYDMAGNVKEWCWNQTGTGRFLLGGGWDELRYMYASHDARPPFERPANAGFRLAKYDRPPGAAELAPVPVASAEPGRTRRTPVAAAIFEVYRRQHGYDRTPLNAAIEATEETALWIRQTIAFDAAYGGERMRAHLFLPRGGVGPHQTVVFFPGYDAFLLRSSRDMGLAVAASIVRSGRAFLYPVYKGTYERQVTADPGTNAEREIRVAWSRDLGRAIDYLETRFDIDRDRLAFYGISAGGDAGVTLTAIETRLRASVLQGTGLSDEATPELDMRNYAPRIRVPTLMVSGRYDFDLPLETAQRPLFDLLGTRAPDKRLESVESGHAVPPGILVEVILPWLDRYLGPVAR